MIELIILILIILIPLVLLIQKFPDFFFWLLLMLFFDPGGFFEGYFESNIIGLVDYTDLIFVLIVISILSIKNKINLFNSDKDFKKIFIYLLVFQIYYIIFYGFLIPYLNNRLNFLHFLQKNRMYFMALPIMYGVYIFAQRSLKIFFKLLIIFSFTILVLYLFTLIIKLPIVPIETMERYTGSGIERISMLSYGLIYWILPLAIIIFYIKQKVRINIINEKVIYFNAFLMFITYLLTLTRREYLRIFLTIVLISILVSYIFRVSKIKLNIKILTSVLLGLIVFSFVFPNSLGNIITVFKDTFLVIFTGHNIQGMEEYRVTGTGDMLYVKQIIKENFLLGTGYVPYIWEDIVRLKLYGDTFAMALDASAEVPIYGAFFRLGILGVLFASGIYILILKDLINVTKSIKRFKERLFYLNDIELIMFFMTLYLLFSHFTIQFYALFGVFYSPSTIPEFGVVIGLFYALKKKWENTV